MSRSFLLQKSINLMSSNYQPSVVWGPNGDGDVKTWFELYSIVQKSDVPVNIYLKGAPGTIFSIPYGNYFLNNSLISGLAFTAVPYDLRFEIGCKITGLRGISDSIKITNFANNAILPEVDSLNYLYLSKGSFIRNNGTLGAILKTTPGLITVLSMDGAFTEVGNPAVAIVDLLDNTQVLIYAVNGCIFTDNVLSGPITSTAILQHDGQLNFPFPTQSLFSGTFINAPIGQNGGAGPTSFRPDSSGIFRPLAVGCVYYDTDIGLPVWWNGLGWVDSAGNPA